MTACQWRDCREPARKVIRIDGEQYVVCEAHADHVIGAAMMSGVSFTECGYSESPVASGGTT